MIYGRSYDSMLEMTHARITTSLFCRDAEIARDPVEFAFIKLRFLRATVSRARARASAGNGRTYVRTYNSNY